MGTLIKSSVLRRNLLCGLMLSVALMGMAGCQKNEGETGDGTGDGTNSSAPTGVHTPPPNSGPPPGATPPPGVNAGAPPKNMQKSQ